MGSLIQDIKYGIRMLGKRPGFTAIAVLTLGLGIGANTSIFSVVDAVLLRPLPYPHPERIVFMGESSPQIHDMSISMENFNDWRKMNTVFESMAPYRSNIAILTGEGEAESVRVRQITAGLFPTLGVQPILGRALTPDDDKAGAAPVVLLGDGYWASKFGRDPNVIGKKLNLDGELFTVVGVLPTNKFHGTWGQYALFNSLWRLEDKEGGPKRRGEHPGIYAYARMKPGVTLEQARVEMKDVAARLSAQYPNENGSHSVNVDSLLNAYVGDIRQSLLILLAAVGFVLLIACANVANLMMARATERNRELAIRTALGATRMRLMRQLLTESVILAALGSCLGLLIAYSTSGALAGISTLSVPRIDGVAVNGSVLFFTLGLCLFTGLFFGIFPAWQASRTDIQESMKEGGRGGSASSGRKKLRAALVVAEVSVSLVLLVGAGLTVKSLYRVLRADSGFNPAGVLTGFFTTPSTGAMTDAQRRQFLSDLTAKLQTIPGVQFSGIKNPLLGGNQTSYIVEGRPRPSPQLMPSTDISRVTPGTIPAMGIRLLKGRDFTTADTADSEPVCIVDATMAQTNWPNDDPIGKHISVNGRNEDPNDPIWRKVVGVVSHVKNYGVDQLSRVETLIPYSQMPGGGGYVILRTSGDPASLSQAMRDAVQSVNPNIPVSRIETLAGIVDENVAPRRLTVLLLGSFAGLALALAAVGIYGVMSYTVLQRTQEIGIRIALGAARGDIFRLVVRSGMALLIIGIAIGIGGALYLSRFLGTILFQVRPTDLWTFIGVPAILAAIG
ncbi:MAG TPA: ABC transporter permease, partial [Candidatus Acidoferrum sp.]|nr:ABC transporter permease [Candidatus Acidoferrum sp.]